MPKPHPFPIGLEIYELSRLLRRLIETRARALGFTQAQWRVLWHLGRNQGISQAGLAEILDMQPISLVRVLDRLEDSDQIERRPDPTDRRAVQLYLGAGAGPKMDALQAVGQEVKAIVAMDLAPGEEQILFDLLRRVRGSLEDAATAQEAGAA